MFDGGADLSVSVACTAAPVASATWMTRRWPSAFAGEVIADRRARNRR